MQKFEPTLFVGHAMLAVAILCEMGTPISGTAKTRVPLSGFEESCLAVHVESEACEIALAIAQLKPSSTISRAAP